MPRVVTARIFAALCVLLLSLPSWAQQPIGRFTPGHALRAATTSGSFSDAGGAAGSAQAGQNYLTEVGITNTGLPFCINDALTSVAYRSFCFGHDASGNALLSIRSWNGASTGSLRCDFNGVIQNCFGSSQIPWIFDITAPPYNAVCDNVHDDSAAIQAAINAAGAVPGGTLIGPAGKTCYTGTTSLVVGNGSAIQYSTYSGVVITGSSGANTLFGGFGNTDIPSWRIRKSGPGPVIRISGPLSGWGVPGLQLQCDNSAGSIGLEVVSAQYGSSPNLSIDSCRKALSLTTVDSKPAGIINIDSLGNSFENLQIFLRPNEVDTYYGIVEDGKNINGNSDFNKFSNVTIVARCGVAGPTVYDIYLGATDSSSYDGVLDIGSCQDGVNGVTRKIAFDYSNAGTNLWPAGTTLSKVELAQGVGVINIGTPNPLTAANYWNNVKYTNQGHAPILSNLIVDFAKGSWTPALRGSSVAGTFTYPAFSQLGDYEISGYDVTARFHIATSAVSGASGALEITGLPIPPSASATTVRGGCTITGYSGITLGASYNSFSAWVSTVDNSIAFVKSGDGLSAVAFISAGADVANATALDGSCTYRRAQVY